MGLIPLLKKQLTPTKLVYHVLFWGFHWGIFAYGWYGFPAAREMAGMADIVRLGGSKRMISAWPASTRLCTRCGSREVPVWF